MIETLNIHKVILPHIPISEYGTLDLSIDNEALAQIDVANANALQAYIDQVREKSGALVLYGGYLEHRAIYDRSDVFAQGANRRNRHLGLDLWAPAGTEVHAMHDGRIHSFAYNDGWGNYGPTVILEHQIDGKAWFTLYGHLSMEDMTNWKVGQQIAGGSIIGHLGDPAENGDYPPHLHLQVIHDIGSWQGDYPGVCSEGELAYYQSNCPDPWTLMESGVIRM